MKWYIIDLKYKSKPVDDVEYEEENREGDEEELVNPRDGRGVKWRMIWILKWQMKDFWMRKHL